MYYSAKFTVHKGKLGAFQASPMAPSWESEVAKDKTGKVVTDRRGDTVYNHKVTREGSILVEMAPFKEEKDGNLYYDWSKKVSFALGVPDITKIADKAGEKFSLVHDTDSGMKVMFFTPGEGKYEGTMNLSLSHKQGDAEVAKASIAMSAGEFSIFTRMLYDAVPVLLGWNEVSNLY